ncbi:MAG TPA: hypothetical protein VFM68_04540 [Candidatus Saccharimonadales bacterium]|nr:hypothetical protein [Candidatus Saccharimonadales bacterium]
MQYTYTDGMVQTIRKLIEQLKIDDEQIQHAIYPPIGDADLDAVLQRSYQLRAEDAADRRKHKAECKQAGKIGDCPGREYLNNADQVRFLISHIEQYQKNLDNAKAA